MELNQLLQDVKKQENKLIEQLVDVLDLATKYNVDNLSIYIDDEMELDVIQENCTTEFVKLESADIREQDIEETAELLYNIGLRNLKSKCYDTEKKAS